MQQDIWYYAQNNQQQGPVTLEQLRSLCSTHRLAPGDLLWTVGMEQWQAAGEVPALADAFSGTVTAPAPWPNPHMNEPQPLPPPSAGYPLQFPLPLDYAPQPPVPAGFWMRFAAYIIDYLITGVVGCLIGGVFGGIIGAVSVFRGESSLNSEPLITFGSGVLGVTIAWLYYALMECSSTQATLGKMALGLKVTDMDGKRLTFSRATGRFFGKIVSGLILCIGFMMAGWTEKKQALHDILAGTLVVRK